MDPSTAEAKHLPSFIERIERLDEDRKQVGDAALRRDFPARPRSGLERAMGVGS